MCDANREAVRRPCLSAPWVAVYTAQAEQLLLARAGQGKRDAMYEQEHLDAMIEAADNVARLRA
jgi:hypothetical protein